MLLTETDPINNFDGSVDPFTTPLNPDVPSTTTPYARDWSGELAPQSGDQFMLTSDSKDDYLIMTITAWCGFGNLEAPACGGSGHPGYAVGTVVNKAGEDLGTMFFNGCHSGGGCRNSGGDGIGFSTHGSWSNGADNCYGGCWSGSQTSFFWASVETSGAEIISMYYKMTPRPEPGERKPPSPTPFNPLPSPQIERELCHCLAMLQT